MLRLIKNLTNSPYHIMLADGTRTILPARGELNNVDVHPLHLPLYRMIGYFQIDESEVDETLDDNSDTQDDNSGIQPETSGTPDDETQVDDPGTSDESDEEADLEELRSEYEQLSGERPDGRWKEERLSLEIAKLKGE